MDLLQLHIGSRMPPCGMEAYPAGMLPPRQGAAVAAAAAATMQEETKTKSKRRRGGRKAEYKRIQRRETRRREPSASTSSWGPNDQASASSRGPNVQASAPSWGPNQDQHQQRLLQQQCPQAQQRREVVWWRSRGRRDPSDGGESVLATHPARVQHHDGDDSLSLRPSTAACSFDPYYDRLVRERSGPSPLEHMGESGHDDDDCLWKVIDDYLLHSTDIDDEVVKKGPGCPPPSLSGGASSASGAPSNDCSAIDRVLTNIFSRA